MTAPIPRGHYRPPAVESTAAAPSEHRAVATLRVITYILTSVASLLFVVLVIYGYVKVMEFQAAMQELGRSLGGPPR